MSELVKQGFDSEAVAQASSAPVVSAGLMLRAAREAQGLHIGALAVALKVSVKKLEALESDRFDVFADTVFLRALASSVCRTLKIDPSAILALLPRSQIKPITPVEAGLNTAFKQPGNSAFGTLLAQLKKPMSMVFVVLLLAALAIAFWPPAAPPLAVETSVQEPPMAVAVPVASGQVPTPPLPATDALAPALAVPSPAAAAPAEVAATVATPGAVAQALSPLTLHASGVSWVEVIDAKGTVQLSKLTQAGENFSVSGVLPLSVVVGRADVITATVRGQAFDVAAIAKSNVARFEVK